VPRYNEGTPAAGRLPPWWVTPTADQARRLNQQVPGEVVSRLSKDQGVSPSVAVQNIDGPVGLALREHWPRYMLGTDVLGRSLLIRCLTGGGISLAVGLAAAVLSVFIGTMYGAIAGYRGGRLDAFMMRIVDVLYGLPYVLLVVLLAVAGDSLLDEYISRARERAGWVETSLQRLEQEEVAGGGAERPLERLALRVLERARGEGTAPTIEEARALIAQGSVRETVESLARIAVPARQVSAPRRTAFDLLTLLVAIGGVSWLTMARVIRGQVMSLKNQPFVEAARAIGAPGRRIFARHLLPNLVGPIVVYTTLTVPQAILQESFLSFLGIGVKTPLPSWGNLAADGLEQMNPYQSSWWLLLFPCLLLGLTLLAMNFVGEALREALDPRRVRR